MKDLTLRRALAQLRRATEFALGYEPQLIHRAEASAILDERERLLGGIVALRDLVGYYEESDPFPTSDGHPLYAARSALTELDQR